MSILIPLHPSQYKAIQNIHKGRDVRENIPAEEKQEYESLRNNYEIIYEYFLNKFPEKYPINSEIVFEERKSIKDSVGTGKILKKINRLTTNYLGQKAKVTANIQTDIGSVDSSTLIVDTKANKPSSKILLYKDPDGDEEEDIYISQKQIEQLKSSKPTKAIKEYMEYVGTYMIGYNRERNKFIWGLLLENKKYPTVWEFYDVEAEENIAEKGFWPQGEEITQKVLLL